jgi:hypothetical protein
MYTTDQRIVIVEIYIGKRTFMKCRERFICRYPDAGLPTKSCMSKLIKKWQTTRPVLDKT